MNTVPASSLAPDPPRVCLRRGDGDGRMTIKKATAFVRLLGDGEPAPQPRTISRSGFPFSC